MVSAKDGENETQFILTLSFHHAIADGIGAAAVVQALVGESTRLRDGKYGQEQGYYTACGTDRILPSLLEDVLDTVPTMRHIWRPLLLDLFPSWLFLSRASLFWWTTDQRNRLVESCRGSYTLLFTL